jgi:hypothetical protein
MRDDAATLARLRAGITAAKRLSRSKQHVIDQEISGCTALRTLVPPCGLTLK